MPETLQIWTPWIIAGVALLALFIFLAALFFFRRGRRAPYWRLRRAASQRGWQLFLLAVALFLLAVTGCLVSGLAQLLMNNGALVQRPDALPSAAPTEAAALLNTETLMPSPPEPTSTETGAAISLPEALPTITTAPQLTPTIPATVASSATSQPEASATPTAASTATGAVVESDVTFGPDAWLEIATLASAVNDAFEPLDAGIHFAEGLTRIYFWVQYGRMTNGAVWSRSLLRDGVVLQQGMYRWAGGDTGEAVYFFGDSEGLSAGAYTIQVFLGDTLAAEMAFSVDAVGSG